LQWARLASHANGDVGSAAIIHVFKYGDYLLTCPLLTLDLLWSLNLPFKLSGAVGVFVCIGCALGCQVFYGPARYMWFGFGITLFTFTWFNILMLTRQRLCQLVSKEAIKMRESLSFALFFYFGIWLCFPTLWVLKETKVINEVVSLCLHMVIDVLSKSVYGFALLNFQIRSEELEFIYLPLRSAPIFFPSLLALKSPFLNKPHLLGSIPMARAKTVHMVGCCRTPSSTPSHVPRNTQS
jgi:bacteriorhodopsin